MSRFRDSDEFGPTLDSAAERIGISPTAVEKDYWVSEVLRVLVVGFPGDFIFKGGTSLSKGYGIVERFSEDIDVARVRATTRQRLSDDRLRGCDAQVTNPMTRAFSLPEGFEARTFLSGSQNAGLISRSGLLVTRARPTSASRAEPLTT